MARNRFGSKTVTQAGALAALRGLLCSARSIDDLTPDRLVSMYRVDRQTAEYELTMARQRRAAPAAISK